MIDERPDLDLRLSAEIFRQYYYLKEELVDFCRKNNLQATGSKSELSERIEVFLESGKRIRAERKTRKTQSAGEIKPNNIIEENFVCSEKHRAFFKEQVGKSFSFNVAFQKWLAIAQNGSVAAFFFFPLIQFTDSVKKLTFGLNKRRMVFFLLRKNAIFFTRVLL